MPRPRNDKFTKDLFYFKRYDPGAGEVYDIKFEAHITDISDSSNPNWSEYYNMGRGDPTLMYSGMNRSLNISFKVIALNKEEHINNHEVLLARLGKLTYPLYKSGLGYNGSHVFFKIGGLYEGFGVLTSVNYNWTNENVWIENRPIYTDVSVSIRVLADSQGKRPSTNSRYFI